MTEDEAKTKWCLQSQATENPFKCDASFCMAWRWLGAPAGGGRIEHADGSTHTRTLVLVDKNYGICSEIPEFGHGYCGLAGKP